MMYWEIVVKRPSGARYVSTQVEQSKFRGVIMLAAKLRQLGYDADVRRVGPWR